MTALGAGLKRLMEAFEKLDMRRATSTWLPI